MRVGYVLAQGGRASKPRHGDRFLGKAVTMTDAPNPPIVIRGLPKPLLRPLPTLLAYANLTTPLEYENASHVGRLVNAHLSVFRAMLVLFTRNAGLPPATIERYLRKCDALTAASGSGLLAPLNEILEDLRTIRLDNGDVLKTIARQQGDRLRNLFRAETGPRKLVTIHNEETWHFAAELNTKLTDGCWYDSEGCHEEDGPRWLHTTDIVLLVPGKRPIRPDIEQAAVGAQIPVIVLAGVGAEGKRKNMAALRTEHGYRCGDHQVVRRPFAPVRLFQAIDRGYLHHVASQEMPSRSLALSAT